jgi:positive regulator of sigma E activity
MINESGETGIVTEVTGNIATVVFSESQACDHCSSRSFCRPNGTGTRKIRAENEINAEVGHQVFVRERGNLLVMLSLMQSGMPLLGLLIGIFVAYSANLALFGLPRELVITGCGLFGMLVGGGVTRIWATYKASTVSSGFEVVSRL